MRKSLALVLAFVATVTAQPPQRRASNLAALLAFPGFYHLRPILMVGTLVRHDNGELRVSDDSGSMTVVYKGSVPDGTSEVRGEFWDLGRMHADDPRLAGLDVQSTFHIDPEANWPRQGQVLAIVATAVSAASPPPAPSIRGMVLHPNRYLDQKITVTGQFTGRNLLGDLPDAPGRSRYDFVLRATDAAIWVINLRPKGKDFDLALDARIDTGRWLEVTGVVRQGRGLQWIDGEAGSLRLTKPLEEPKTEAPIRVPAGPPPEVVFSTPIEDESDVSLGTSVRIQFSRDLDPSSIKGHVRVKYTEAETALRGEPVTPPIEFTTQYNGANRVLEIRFGGPLERFRTVQVELLEGILGTDKQPLKPWALMFLTGG